MSIIIVGGVIGLAVASMILGLAVWCDHPIFGTILCLVPPLIAIGTIEVSLANVGRNLEQDNGIVNAELVKIESANRTNPTTNSYYKVIVGNRMYIYKLIEIK